MLEIHKSYIVNENQQPIAVQIPIEQFDKIEEILDNYGLAILIEETESDERLSKEHALKYYNSSSDLTTQLEEMANDPSIQSEIPQIEQEFKITEMDNLLHSR